MNLRKMYTAVICVMVAVLIAALALLTRFRTLSLQSRNLNQDGIRLITYSNEMLHINDYLIKLMRVFSISHNTKYLDEYYSLLTYDNLDGKLDSMKAIGLTRKELDLVEDLHKLLSELAAIEERAILDYYNKDYETSRNVIFSSEYADKDIDLSQKTKSLITSITARVETGVDEIQNRLGAMRIYISVMMSVSIAALIVLQIMQRNRVLKPIVKIERVMQSIEQGNAGVRLHKKHDDEIGALFDHVNDMAASIEKYMRESDNSLNILKNILNGLDAYIYATIPDTCEILFINDKMKEHYNIEGDGTGEICYKVLQDGFSEKCEFCPCRQLDEKPDSIVVWEQYNSRTKRYYRNTDCYIDWVGGIKAHLQHAVDITDLKKYMNEKLSAERAALEMKHEKERAETEARAKSDFLAKMSHEIRTPMNAVMGMSELILRKNLPPDVFENAVGIKNASMNLLSIINDILDLSKIESGMMEIIDSDYMLPSLINDVIGITKIRLIDKPIQFAACIDPNIPAELIGDEVRIRQMLINLLSNAVKYTAEGFVMLTVTASERSGDSITLTAEVSDSGIGVKEEDFGKLFGDFVQIDTVKNKGVVGTGLGLAITRNLARLMGGDVTLESEYGKGSTFSLKVPQKVRGTRPFASVNDKTGKSVLLYETREVYKNSIVSALEALHINYTSVDSIPALFDGFESHDFVFISSFMYSSVNPALLKLSKQPKLVLLSDVTESFVPGDARVLSLPAHSLTIANMLEGNYTRHSEIRADGISFSAPEARVLIVDDIAANLKVCEGLLMPYNMDVTLASGGREALTLVKEKEFDLVFMDHMMPEMDGLEVTKYIREMDGEYYKSLPIIALTANAVSGVREMFIQNGMNDFLSKPIETAKLDAILVRWIPKEKRKKAAEKSPEPSYSPLLEKLKMVPELSIDEALKVVGGSAETLERIITLAVRLLPENIDELETLIEGDMASYATQVHGIKGVLNNVGAYSLGEAAYELEKLSKSGDRNGCKEKHPAFIEALRAFLFAMKPLIESKESKEAGDITRVLKALPELEEAVDSYDSVVSNRLVLQLVEYTYSPEIDEKIEGMRHSFEHFDFDRAAELIKDLKEELEDGY